MRNRTQYLPRRMTPETAIKLKTSEHQEQALLFEWAKWNEARFPELKWLFAIINGAKLPWRKNKYGQRYSAEANRLKAEGLKAGVFDLCLPVARGGYHGLFCELKIKPNKLTPEQEDFQQHLIQENYKQAVCYSMEEAKYEILNYLGLRKYSDYSNKQSEVWFLCCTDRFIGGTFIRKYGFDFICAKCGRRFKGKLDLKEIREGI